MINVMKYDGKTTGAMAATAVVKAEKAIAADVQAKLIKDAGASAKNEPDAVAEIPDGVEKWTKDFGKSSKLKDEFGKIDFYLSYMNGLASGRVKSYKGGN